MLGNPFSVIKLKEASKSSICRVLSSVFSVFEYNGTKPSNTVSTCQKEAPEKVSPSMVSSGLEGEAEDRNTLLVRGGRGGTEGSLSLLDIA